MHRSGRVGGLSERIPEGATEEEVLRMAADGRLSVAEAQQYLRRKKELSQHSSLHYDSSRN